MQLKRSLRIGDLFLLIVGTVIGSGIFLVPGAVLRQVNGDAKLAIGVWIAGGVLSLMGALTYGELAAAEPNAGGLYFYIRQAFGPMSAFIYGWTLFLLIGTGSVATLSVAFSGYFAQFVDLSPLAVKSIAVALIAVVAAVNVRGTRQGADLQNWTTATKCLAIVVMGGALLFAGHTPGVVSSMPMVTGSLAARFGTAMIAVLWAYEGWQYCSFSAGEAINPQRTFPRAFLWGALALIAIYLVANAGYLAALGPSRAASTDTIAMTAVTGAFGSNVAKFVGLAILISIFSAANGLTLTTPRAYFAMANDGLFFKKLAEISPRYGTPVFAIVASSVWASFLAFTGTFEQLFTYVVFTGWIFYGLAAAAVFVYRRKHPDLARPYRVPGYPWTPAIFVIAAFALVVNTIVMQPSRGLAAVALVLLGIPAYGIWRRVAARQQT